MMKFWFEQRDGVLIISLEGRLDSEGSQAYAGLLPEWIEGFNKVVLDMKDVTYINSTFLCATADSCATIRAAGGDIVLCNLLPKVKRVMAIVGQNKYVLVFDTVDDAVAGFPKNDTDRAQKLVQQIQQKANS